MSESKSRLRIVARLLGCIVEQVERHVSLAEEQGDAAGAEAIAELEDVLMQSYLRWASDHGVRDDDPEGDEEITAEAIKDALTTLGVDFKHDGDAAWRGPVPRKNFAWLIYWQDLGTEDSGWAWRVWETSNYGREREASGALDSLDELPSIVAGDHFS